jgi:hypothetical protein
MIGKMTYIDEVCAALLDDTEHKYLKARTHLGQVKEACDIPRDEHAHLIASAQREYLRASKEYLAIAFKTKFLGVELE